MSKPKVLVVDDNPANLLALEALLDDFDIELLQASSGEEAISLLSEHTVAVMLLDVQMPGMDGYEVAEAMQRETHTRHVPIIFVTAIDHNVQHVLRGYASGAVDFLTKPIDATVLQSKVRVFLELDQKGRELSAANQLLEQSLREVERLKHHNELLLRSIGEGILSLDRRGNIIFANPAAHTLLGETGSLTGASLIERLAGPAAERSVADLLAQCLQGNSWTQTVSASRGSVNFPAQIIATPLKDDKGLIAGVSIAFQDGTEYQRRESALRAESERDPLTGLVNRRGLERHLQRRLPYGANRTALIYIDLNNFKPVNDQYGHRMGDLVLKEVAERFNSIAGTGDLVARIGGDEFCIVISHDTPKESASAVATNLYNAFSAPLLSDEANIRIGISVGIAIGKEGDNVEKLLNAADMAMLECKRSEDEQFRFA
ncbi:MAG: diguanylate cyclase [Gammaproteobacteria bacterium]|nr:diguanylate cyclase [Gammaproteobacteria bacterium]MBQ0773767.1 diguanylate cyclase [Gammaproteobacteria bacterium]